jgi:hypothetical protein
MPDGTASAGFSEIDETCHRFERVIEPERRGKTLLDSKSHQGTGFSAKRSFCAKALYLLSANFGRIQCDRGGLNQFRVERSYHAAHAGDSR